MRKVNDYIIFYDDVIGKGSFGTVVKAQLAADLMDKQGKGAQQTVRPHVDPTKTVYACKIFDVENFNEDDLQIVFKEVKINSMVRSDYCIRHHQTIKTSNKIYMI